MNANTPTEKRGEKAEIKAVINSHNLIAITTNNNKGRISKKHEHMTHMSTNK